MEKLPTLLCALSLSLPAAAAWAQDPGEAEDLIIHKPTVQHHTRQILDRVRVGGYFDLEYHGRDLGDSFRAHRLILLLEGQVDERISFITEIELEDGSELEVEFAHMDYKIADALNFRGGILLSPLGRLNLYHDSPIQELTDRPLMHRSVIPTTLREPGAGFFGKLHQTSEGGFELGYEFYGTTGFKGLDEKGNAQFSRGSGLRDGAPFKQTGKFGVLRDNNDDIAVLGRLSAKGRGRVLGAGGGYELGLSFHSGDYDPDEDNRLSIYAMDALVRLAGLEVLGEYAYADIQRDAGAVAAGIPNDMRGYYLQAGYKIFPGFFEGLEEKGYVGEGSHLTLLARLGGTDLAGAKKERLTVGFNFRPNHVKTVFKFEYQWNDEGGSQAFAKNNGFVAGFATYF